MLVVDNPLAAEDIAKAFRNHIARHRGQALLLTGQWGAGKTHLFRTELKPLAKASSLKVIYLTVSGISSAEQLEQALFIAAHPLFKVGFLQAAAAVFLAARGLIGLGSLSFESLRSLEAAIDSSTLIVFDDIERCESKLLPALFGKISMLLEVKRAHVLLIGNEEQILSDEYPKNKEKIIARSVLYAPTVDTTLRVTLEALSREMEAADPSRDFLSETNISPVMRSVLHKTRCRNLRLSMTALQNFFELFQAIPLDLRTGYQDHLPRLLHTTATLSIELGQQPRLFTSIEKIFLTPEDSLFSLYLGTGLGKDDPGVQLLDRALDTREYPAIYATEILRLVQFGVLNQALFLSQIEERLRPSKAVEAHRRLERYRTLTQEDFELALAQVLDSLQSNTYRSLNELYRIALTLFHLKQQSLMDASNYDIFSLITSAVQHVADEAERSNSPAELFDTSIQIGPTTNEMTRVFENIRLVSQRLERSNIKKNRVRLLSMIATDTNQFISEIQEYPYVRSALLTDDSDMISAFNAIKDLVLSPQKKTEEIYAVVNAIGRHYRPEDMTTIVQGESTFLLALESKLASVEPLIEQGQSLRLAALNELRSTLKGVCERARIRGTS